MSFRGRLGYVPGFSAEVRFSSRQREMSNDWSERQKINEVRIARPGMPSHFFSGLWDLRSRLGRPIDHSVCLSMSTTAVPASLRENDSRIYIISADHCSALTHMILPGQIGESIILLLPV